MDTVTTSIRSASATLRTRVSPGVMERVEKALRFAREAYVDLTSDILQGVLLIEHALLCVELLSEFCHDEDALIACVLQHYMRIPDASLQDIEKEFGREVREMVSRIHLLSHLYTTEWRKSIEDMRIMIVSVADDVRVILIVLAIACSYIARLQLMNEEFRLRICRKSLQLFAPIASRLGIYTLKYRLERSAFQVCYPVDAERLSAELQRLHDEGGMFLHKTADAIRQFLTSEGVQCTVFSREKQPYSIFQKMRQKSVGSLSTIHDLFAIRLVVPTVQDCYQVLGLLHRIGTPLSHRFKDYISFPKPNGYQSLHTSLLGLPHVQKDVVVEIQIRTPEMHEEAEYGIAAHWLYKQDKRGSGHVMQSAKHFQLSEILSRQHAVEVSHTAGTSHLEQEMTLVDHLYVLTPRGDIIELPDGATPLDFAFTIHTDVGLRFKGARVNGSIVPLSYKLDNGDSVEIMTHKHPQPALNWLEVLVTSSARTKLKSYFFSNNRADFLSSGKSIFNAELQSRHLPLLDNDLTILSTFDDVPLSMKEREDLLVKIGMSSIRTSSIFSHLALPSVPRKLSSKKKTSRTSSVLPEVILDHEAHGMPYRYAKCCSPHLANPRPEKLTGVITRGGVTVHQEKCGMGKGANAARKIEVQWAR